MSTPNYKIFKYFRRKFFIAEQSPPPDVRDAFSKFSDGATTMSADQLRLFLEDHQSELDCTAEDSERIIDNVLRTRKQNNQEESGAAANKCSGDANGGGEGGGQGGGLSIDDFFHFLFFDDFNDPLKSQV